MAATRSPWWLPTTGRIGTPERHRLRARQCADPPRRARTLSRRDRLQPQERQRSKLYGLSYPLPVKVKYCDKTRMRRLLMIAAAVIVVLGAGPTKTVVGSAQTSPSTDRHRKERHPPLRHTCLDYSCRARVSTWGDCCFPHPLRFPCEDRRITRPHLSTAR